MTSDNSCWQHVFFGVDICRGRSTYTCPCDIHVDRRGVYVDFSGDYLVS